MGSLAPISLPWIPEDDLKLKNAVEAGASLESLAKGAVQFSRKFTVRELRERWHSLLYDPFVSEEAAALMFECERSVSSLPSKASRCGNAKENILPGKRKAESVRSCYYDRRKRICKEPFNSMDLGFLVEQDDNNCVGNVGEPLSANCMLGVPTSKYFGFQQPNLDTIHHSFPQLVMDDTAANSVGHACHTGGLRNVGDNNFPAEENRIQEDIPHIPGENQCLVRNCSRVGETGQSKELQVCNRYGVGDLEAKCSSNLDHIYNDSGNLCSGYEGTRVFNSPISDCGAPFHMGYSSPLPEIPIWRTIEGISAPDMPIGISIAEKHHCRRDEFALPDDSDAKNTSTSGFDVGHSDSMLKNQIPCDELKCSSTEGYLEALSNSLFFTNDEELIFMDGDGKDVIDKSYYDGLSSLLLNSPIDTNQDHMPTVTEPELPPDSYLALPDAAYPGETNENGNLHHVDGHSVVIPEIQILSSTSTINSQNPELCDGVICCMLNTEDQEIPLNDDVILPKKMLSALSTAAQKNYHEAKNRSVSFVKDILENKKHSESIPSLMTKERKDLGQFHVSSKGKGTRGLPEMGLHHPICGCGSRIELPEDDALHRVSRGASAAFGVPKQINSANVSTKAVLPKKLKEECIETELEKHLNLNLVDFYQEEPSNRSDSFKSHPWKNDNFSIQEIDVPATSQNHQVPHAELGPMDVKMEETVAYPSTSDQDELPFEDDDCVPYFSDIETMILGMDLGPDDQDVHFSEAVSKFHHDDIKRKIIRLEQSIHACMQREIAFHGAFAVLYGRHLKHFIKKPKVLLGRATEDIIVDIDLGREGCANNISRRQAIMKMDDLGNFYLKNLGKCSIFVNDMEVASGQSRTLNSDSVIKIKEMWFNFETNQTCVKRYMENFTSRSNIQEHKF